MQNVKVEQWFYEAFDFHQKGRLKQAKKLYSKIININPNHFDALHLLGLIAYQEGALAEAEALLSRALRIEFDASAAYSNYGLVLLALNRGTEAIANFDKAIKINPRDFVAYFNKGVALHDLKRFLDAVLCYDMAIEINPDYADAYCNRGRALVDLARFEDSIISFDKAISLDADYAIAFYNRGNAFKELKRYDEALASYDKAISIKSDFAEALSNRGNTLTELKRFDEALAAYDKAITIKSDYAEAFYNRGILLGELKRFDEALASCDKAITVKADFPEALIKRGNALRELGRLADAETSYKKAIAINPENEEAQYSLGLTFLERDNFSAALETAIRSIKMKPTFEAKRLFVEATKRTGIQSWDQSLSQLVIAALIEPWGNPSEVMPFACRLVRADKDFLQILERSKVAPGSAKHDENLIVSVSKSDFHVTPLLNAMLISSPIPDYELEIFFTAMRHHLLKEASSLIFKDRKIEDTAPLYCCLARQCFINEHVYFQTPEEIDLSQQLRERLAKALQAEQTIPACWIIAVACYFPLHAVEGAEKLLQQKWPEDVESVLKQQIREPLAELDLRRSLFVLTPVENQVSLVVQSQYEQNPYPRWISLPKYSVNNFLESYFRTDVPVDAFQKLVSNRNPEILIAGCGTGQHAIGIAQSVRGAKILAVDLSLASLAYAKRKTLELGIESVEYAQADLLKLASHGRTFDVIEAVGVLHHLENPFEGWEVLLSLLRPHGLMKLGFYSELARRDIVRMRNFIATEGIGSSSRDIRNYRQHLLESGNSEDYGFVTSCADFFSASGCRDLLFHVQEHRMNLNILADFLETHDLTFLGFDIDRSVIHAYKQRFPNDQSAANLEQWRIYEEENPNTFVGMYQFSVQNVRP